MRADFHLFVLVPFFEGNAALQACLSSLFHQTAPFTAVVVDDGSSEAAHRIATTLTTDDRFILLRRSSRGGPAAARQTGLDYICHHSQSDQDVVVMLDGDDRLIRDRALECIADIYARNPVTKMTFGKSISHQGARICLGRYRDWHLRLNLARHVPGWHGDHPRSFRLGLYREARPALRLRYPGGEWLQGATDIALLLPMLDCCGPDDVIQIDTTLYEYRYGRIDGRTLGAHQRGRTEQYLGEYYTRRSLVFTAWKALRYPARTYYLIREVLRRLSDWSEPEREDCNPL